MFISEFRLTQDKEMSQNDCENAITKWCTAWRLCQLTLGFGNQAVRYMNIPPWCSRIMAQMKKARSYRFTVFFSTENSEGWVEVEASTFYSEFIQDGECQVSMLLESLRTMARENNIKFGFLCSRVGRNGAFAKPMSKHEFEKVAWDQELLPLYGSGQFDVLPIRGRKQRCTELAL
jgi:hypothetical protein